MTVLFRIPIHLAVGTSLFTLVFMSGGSTIIHLATGSLGSESILDAVVLGLGAMVGAQIGAWIGKGLRGQTIHSLLALALGGIGVRVLVVGFFRL